MIPIFSLSCCSPLVSRSSFEMMSARLGSKPRAVGVWLVFAVSRSSQASSQRRHPPPPSSPPKMLRSATSFARAIPRLAPVARSARFASLEVRLSLYARFSPQAPASSTTSSQLTLSTSTDTFWTVLRHLARPTSRSSRPPTRTTPLLRTSPRSSSSRPRAFCRPTPDRPSSSRTERAASSTTPRSGSTSTSRPVLPSTLSGMPMSR